MKIKIVAGLVAAIALAGSGSLKAQSTNFVAYNFDVDQVATTPYASAWGNWFGGYFQSAVWDNTVDVSNNPNSGSLKLTLNLNGHDQYVLNDGINPAPNYGPVNLSVFTNLSFDMRYDASSAIRTNANGTLDFGAMRAGSRNPAFAQDWIMNFTIPATNGLGQPNTNWVHINVDLRQVPINFSDLSAGLVNILIGMDGNNFGNAGFAGTQIIWFDNVKYGGFLAPIPPPSLTFRKTIPALRLFGGNGLYGRSQLSLVDTTDGWVGANNYPVSYSFTLMGNATSPGNLDTHIQFIPLDWDTSTYQGNSGADYFAETELWLRILSGTGTNTTAVADISWKTNASFSNPAHTDLTITNAVRAGTWTLTFTGPTNGTLTAPGASPAPFVLSMTADQATNNFNGKTGPNGNLGVGIRIGNMNNGNTANGGVPDDWSSISISGAAGTNFVANFTSASNSVVDTNLWNLGNSDGNTLQVQVPTNAPYWINWTTPDTGFNLIYGNSLTNAGQSWNDLSGSITPVLTGGIKWALIPSSLLASNVNFFGLINRAFTKLQVLLPGETNAPGTLTGKIGKPDTNSISAGAGLIVTINAVDSSYHIVTSASGDAITITTTDSTAVISGTPTIANGTATEQIFFETPGTFTVTGTDTTNTNIPPATSSSVTAIP